MQVKPTTGITSHSQLAVYRECPYKWALKYRFHLVPRHLSRTKQHDRRFGIAMHTALALIHAPQRDVELALDAFEASYPPAAYPRELPSRSQGKSFTGGVAALEAYADRWRAEDADWEVLEVEQLETSQAAALDDTSHVVVLDLIVRDRRDGEVYAVDHKVTGKYLKDLWSKHALDSQIRMYADHVREKYGHCAGFIINGLSLRHRSKAYTPRSGPDKGRQLPAGDWFSFERQLYSIDGNAVQLERENVRYWKKRLAHDAAIMEQSDNCVPGYNTAACWGGTDYECEYYAACKPGYIMPRDAEIIEQNFRQECAAHLDGNARCHLDSGHEGDCSPLLPEPDDDSGFDVELDPADSDVYA